VQVLEKEAFAGQLQDGTEKSYFRRLEKKQSVESDVGASHDISKDIGVFFSGAHGAEDEDEDAAKAAQQAREENSQESLGPGITSVDKCSDKLQVLLTKMGITNLAATRTPTIDDSDTEIPVDIEGVPTVDVSDQRAIEASIAIRRSTRLQEKDNTQVADPSQKEIQATYAASAAKGTDVGKDVTMDMSEDSSLTDIEELEE
jgi:hypothetical protein